MSTKEEDKHLEEDLDVEDGTGKKLSAAQKKKLKAKEKAAKEAEEKAKTPVDSPAVDADLEDSGPGVAKGKKGKKGGAGARGAIAAAALEKIKLKQQFEEEQRRIEEEERRKEEEEERIRQAEIQKQKEIDDAKKKIKQEKKRILMEQGKWVSKAQKEKNDQAKRLRQQLIEQGVIKAEDINEDEEEEVAEKKQKSMVVRNKKKKKEAKQEEGAAEEKEEEHESTTATTAERKISDVQKAPATKEEAQAEAPEEEDVAEDWDKEDIDEMAAKIASKQVNPATTGGKAIRGADEEDEDESELLKKQAKKGKDQQKIKNAVKASKEEEKAGAGVFDQTESQSTAAARAQRLAELKAKQEARKQEVIKSQQQKKQAAFKLRCPILCILGHVDTGKTLILDKLRRTNVQAGEAGGITQQIGATYFPESAIIEHMQRMHGRLEFDLQVPGYQIIDTPGHESFTNLRNRGSSLCDFAILVVDIMHGLENQTLESLQLLKQKKCPFVVALNKIDRIYQWKSKPFNNVRDSLESQEASAKHEFRDRLNKTILAFAEEGINAALYWENDNPQEYISLVPTSAITGEGLPDLVSFISYLCQTNYKHQLKEKEDFECSVLEVKVIEGLGTTIDIILVNGILRVGDTIILAGFNGPIVTTIRALLTPQPMREMRVKGDYIHHDQIKGSMGIKISAPGLENAMAGSELYKADTDEEIEQFKTQIADDLVDIMDKYVDKTSHGVCVQASTIGSLEALLEFLKTMKIPVTSINIGPVYKKDILKAMKSLQGDHIQKEYATILAFDVKVMPDAQQYADDNNIVIFTANIIYHLFDQFQDHVKKCRDDRKSEEGSKAVFPCILEMVKGAIFHVKDPLVIGVTVKAGILKIGTPLCIPDKENLRIGRVESIELNAKPLQMAKPTHGGVAVKITGDSSITYGRHFDETNQIVSLISRDSIDALKQYFKDDLQQDDWKLVVQLKKMFGIP